MVHYLHMCTLGQIPHLLLQQNQSFPDTHPKHIATHISQNVALTRPKDRTDRALIPCKLDVCINVETSCEPNQVQREEEHYIVKSALLSL